MCILKVDNIEKTYGDGYNEVKALKGLSFVVEKGEFVAISGSSGSGKSTLLNILGGLDNPSKGKVWIAGKNLERIYREEKTIFRRKNIGFIFQQFNLIHILNVYENIVLPLQLDGQKIDHKYVKNIIEVLGLQDKTESMPYELSGGQQQRVAIARAIVNKPAIILADEPTGNLDSENTKNVLELLKFTMREFKQTMIMITHNEEVAKTADRILRIEDGMILK
ncbi:ABC transporter ATP-binding protein [Anaerosacchariphilus polymeriproducens]|uniref:ABC transporter ATP-binding protein n=1 Tax=Anaerosacchariphilus polymeriproducens TaxID=1812858 RepID=A0A371ASG8_9FIRM|nr:ABC transporter ATP-binding protein [Anaerosacchariphilus polymeriproducens]RDU22482.1 ABC transporter ATP-binding protein [Anaerosacchariphilus polymeriproducens]